MTGPDTCVLTSDELMVLDCLARGMTGRATAKHLRRSYAQVKRRCGRIYSKLNAANNAHAVALAHEAGLLPQSTHDVIRVINALTARLPTPSPSRSGKDIR